VDSDDELALIAAISGVPLQCVGSGRFAALARTPSASKLRQVFKEHVLDGFEYLDPYSEAPISFADAVECCRFWRELIDSNRDIGAAVGFALWKRSTVAPLLWRGSDGTPFTNRPSAIRPDEQVAIWRSRTSQSVISGLQRRGARPVEVEDGFIRSAGLGADCVPPLSIVVDRLGAHFEADRETELEQLLQRGVFSLEILDRARRIRQLIVDSGISKYGSGRGAAERRAENRKLIFVPGQVEDDRAVLSGGAGLTSNLELLRRVRAGEPDAFILYKPHPDIEAGHRAGAIADEACLGIADEIVRDEPVSALLDMADELHVNTSLAGFEALLRNKQVTTHGVPFYAGWGLTRDLGPVPARRTAKRTLDELVAAVLLLYPRYLDPVTGLPCPAEVLVERLAERSSARSDGLVVRLRKFQGRFKRGVAALRRSG
jgi:capsular polysaccharide export protein